MRHGETIDNAMGVLSNKKIQCSILTYPSREQVVESLNILPRIDKMYTSPLIRTLQTANIISRKCRTRDYIKNNHNWEKITKELRGELYELNIYEAW